MVGCVAPAGMVTVAGEMVTLLLSLDKVTVTPPAAAAADKVTWKAVDWPSPTLTPEGNPMVPMLCTVTVVVAAGTLGAVVLAVIVVDPVAKPVTANVVVVAPAAKVAVAGKVMIPVGLAAKVTVRPPVGAGTDKVRVRFCGAAPISVKPPVGPNPREAPTFTV